MKAGIKIFEKYGDLNIFETLSGGNVMKYKEVEELTVDVALAKLAMEKDKKTYKETYQKVLQQDMDRKQQQNKRR